MWLCILRIVAFVMSVFPIAKHIDENIFLKSLPVSNSHLNGIYNSFDIIAIYMNNRCLHSCGVGGTIITCTCIVEIGREANLVIDDKMDSTTHPVAAQPAHLQNFINDTLTCHCRITVNGYGQYP